MILWTSGVFGDVALPRLWAPDAVMFGARRLTLWALGRQGWAQATLLSIRRENRFCLLLFPTT